MSQDHVKVLPVSAQTTMTLQEIQEKMVEVKPQLEGFVGGWASNNNEKSNLNLTNAEPPKSNPVLYPARDGVPEMLIARFYYWEPATGKEQQLPNFDPKYVRKLSAFDLILTKPNPNSLGILVSARSPRPVRRGDGAVKALEKILKAQNSDTKIDFSKSHLRLKSEEIFLWLAVRVRDKAQISPEIHLNAIDGLTSHDEASRSTDLKSGVDFERAAFLTSVAENDKLGPIDLSFSYTPDENIESYKLRLHLDGGFEFSEKQQHVSDQLERPDFMVETTIFLAYFLIPKINQLFNDDAKNWSDEIIQVIKGAMEALTKRYTHLKEILDNKVQ